MSETYTNNVGRSDYRLPTVSTADNDKILKVVEGEWKKAEGGGGDILIVNISQSGGRRYLDKTYAEIMTAFNNDKPVFANGQYGGTYPIYTVYDNDSDEFKLFIMLYEEAIYTISNAFEFTKLDVPCYMLGSSDTDLQYTNLALV